MWIVFVMDCISHIYLILRSRLHKISFREQLLGKQSSAVFLEQRICFSFLFYNPRAPNYLLNIKQAPHCSTHHARVIKGWFREKLHGFIYPAVVWKPTRQPQDAMRTHYYRRLILNSSVFLQILTWPESRNPTGLKQDPTTPDCCLQVSVSY